MPSKAKPVRWTIEAAAREFGVDRKALTRRLTVSEQQPGIDGRYATNQICIAVFGDKHGEVLRNERLDADIKEEKLCALKKRSAPLESVEKVWERIVQALKQEILYAPDLTQERKHALLEHLIDKIPREEYFQDGKSEEEEDEV